MLVRSLSRASEQTGSTLEECVFALGENRVEAVKTGKVLIGTSSGGTGVTYSLPPLGGLQAEDLAEVCDTILTQIEALEAAGTTEAGMLDGLLVAFSAPAVSIRKNFGGLRL